jgi:hypothetical protein
MSRHPSQTGKSDSNSSPPPSPALSASSSLSSSLSSVPSLSSSTPSASPSPSPSVSPSQSFTFPSDSESSSVSILPTSSSELGSGYKGKDGKSVSTSKKPLQVIRVVMAEWRTQYVTLRCEAHHTVDNFKQLVLLKLGKKGEVLIHMYDFHLCLEDPSTSKK